MVNQPFGRSMQIGVICLLLRLSCIDIGLLWCIYVKSPSTSRDIFTIINRLPYRQQTHSTAWNGYTLMGFLPLSLLQLKWNKCKNKTITDIWCSNNHLILYDLRCRCNSIVLDYSWNIFTSIFHSLQYNMVSKLSNHGRNVCNG